MGLVHASCPANTVSLCFRWLWVAIAYSAEASFDACHPRSLWFPLTLVSGRGYPAMAIYRVFGRAPMPGQRRRTLWYVEEQAGGRL
jgi:hypothetical protein